MANIVILKPRSRDLGNGFMVQRLLPAAERQSVGPFLFFDHFGPMNVPPGGGEPLDAHRFIWWNFVSSRRERIAEAADLWQRQQMPRIAGETEWVPLPEQRFR